LAYVPCKEYNIDYTTVPLRFEVSKEFELTVVRRKEAKLQLYKEQDKPDKLHLSFNGQNIFNWFKQKYQEMKQTANYYQRPNIKSEVGKNKGIKR
jgi:hypothetical protein